MIFAQMIDIMILVGCQIFKVENFASARTSRIPVLSSKRSLSNRAALITVTFVSNLPCGNCKIAFITYYIILGGKYYYIIRIILVGEIHKYKYRKIEKATKSCRDLYLYDKYNHVS